MRKRGITVAQAKKIREEKGFEETRLQRRRVARGLSQGELAKKSGVNVRAIRGYEQGSRPIEGARLETLCQLSEALGCRIGDIIENRELIARYKAVR